MRLVAHGLLGPPLDDPEAVVRHLTCVQAQDWAASTTAIALRTPDRSLDQVHAAYNAGHIVRSWPMRGTLHAVAARDLGWMLGLTGQGMLRRGEKTRAALGLTPAILDIAERVARDALDAGGLSRNELTQRWRDAGLDVTGQRAYHCLGWLAIRGVVCLGPVVDGAQHVVLTQRWITSPRTLHGSEAVAHWLHRYVLSHGPVAPTEFCWWTKLLRRDLAPVLATVRARVCPVEVDGQELWMAPDLPERYAAARRASAAPVLVPAFDELLLGYGDRSATLTKQDEARLVPGGNGVFRPAVLHGGRVVGSWRRPADPGRPVSVESFGDDLPSAVGNALPRLTHRLPR